MKTILLFSVLSLFLFSCAIHTGTLTTSALPNCTYEGIAKVKVGTSHFLGIGGNTRGALILDAKEMLLSNNPPKSGITLTNYTVDIKRTFLILTTSNVITVSAEKYRCPTNYVTTTDKQSFNTPSKEDSVKSKILPTLLETENIQKSSEPTEVQKEPSPVIEPKKEEVTQQVNIKAVDPARSELLEVNDPIYFVMDNVVIKGVIISKSTKSCTIIYKDQNNKDLSKNISKDNIYQSLKIDKTEITYGYQIGSRIKIEVFAKQSNTNVIREGSIIGIGKNGVIMEYPKEDGSIRQLQVGYNKIL